MTTMLVSPLVDLWIRSLPARIHSPAWRLGVIAAGGSVASAPLLALFVLFALAAAAEDQGASYVVFGVSGLGGLLCLLAAALFGLDALQLNGQVQASLADSYAASSVWVGVRLVLSAAGFAILAWAAFRNARGVRRAAVPRAAKGPAVLVSPARSGGASPGLAKPATSAVDD